MFWCETIKNGYKFCTCEGVWNYFRITNASVLCYNLLEVYAIPEDGNRCLIFRMRSGEAIPPSMLVDFKFQSHQHVKIEVYGEDITIIGEAYDGTRRYKNLNRFRENCPFGDEEDWNSKLSSPSPNFEEGPKLKPNLKHEIKEEELRQFIQDETKINQWKKSQTQKPTI